MTSTPAAKRLSPEPVAPSTASGLKQFLNRLQPSPESVVLLLAVLIGTGAGAGVVVFRALIHLVHDLMLGEVLSFLSVWGAWTLALIPILGGLVICLLRWRIRDFGPGLSALMEAVQSGREFLPLKPIAKMVAASISLGSGASLGPEGPSVEIGATFGLLLGQVLQVSQERQRLLLGAGAAAGLAAGFNAPIAGVFFALEVVLGTTFATSAVSVVLLSAVVAAWIAQIGLGSQPAFALPAYEVRSLLELPLYVGLGVLASLVSLLYVQALRRSQQCFQGQVPAFAWLARIPQPLHPVFGGFCLGIVALWLPQILGVGYETVESILQDVQLSLTLVIALLVVKLIMTALSYGSGFVGGIFAPALFLGASLGAAYGKVLAIALPMLHPYMASPPAYAMVGMAAVLAGSVRAPLTAILLLFELTQDYRIVLPLMAAVGLSVWLVEWLEPAKRSEPSKSVQAVKEAIEPVTELPESNPAEPREPAIPVRPAPEPLPLRSDLHSAWDELPPLQVVAALQPLPLQVASDATLASVGTALVEQRCHTAFVMADDRLVGLVTLHDVDRLLMRAKSEGETKTLLEIAIAQLCTTDILLAYPDELLSEAIARMATRGLHQLPIVTRESPNQAIGVLTQESITLAQGLHRTGELLRSQLEVELADAIEPEAALL
ncbi:MAG: CBS domain-containing protein [Leptolyngbyaceae cyanobacterium SM1_3_5]|nr:CBS domain-containing protein [Leptolyngbyaceae cyanobacterium SM1_3_5]